MARTQANRPLGIDTPLGTNKLLLTALHGTEELGRPFRYELELLSESFDLDFDQIVGHTVTARYDRPDGATRYFSGVISRFTQVTAAGRMATYRATLVPWLWLLSKSSDCRAFQNKTVPEIVKAVLSDRGFTDVDENLSGTYAARDYCVQYRETDLDFVSRLLEQDGIYYHFRHESGKHTLVLCDSPAAHRPGDGDAATVAYRAPSNDVTIGYVREWSLARQVESGAYTLDDYDFTKPRAALWAKSQASRKDAYATAALYDYPGGYAKVADGEEYAKIRLQELQARYETATGSADAAGLCAGNTFALAAHPRADQNRSYLLTGVACQITGDAYDSHADSGDDARPSFACQFTAVDAETPYRPARVTPRPTMPGPQTAVVVGPVGHEIHTDAHGRVKLQFDWDRLGQCDEKSSCWVRVAQAWAGKGWGGISVPRVGQEVVVGFLDGDPDRPLVVGRVYNGLAKPPYPLPDRQTVSTLKSNTSPQGGGFNEFRFEDKKGAEQVFVHGEKDADVRVKNDVKEYVGHDRHLVIKDSQFEHVTKERHETVDADHLEQIGGDRHLTVKGQEAKSIQGAQSLAVTGDVAEAFEGNHSEQTTKDYYLKAQNIVLQAGQSITIQVGQSFIALDATGITIGTSGTIELHSTQTTDIKADLGLTITGLKIDAKADAALSLSGGARAELKGPITQVSGDATLILKGGMVLIN